MDLTALRFDPELLPILLVVLVTWGGVLLYLLRLDLLSRRIEDEVRGRDADSPEREVLDETDKLSGIEHPISGVPR